MCVVSLLLVCLFCFCLFLFLFFVFVFLFFVFVFFGFFFFFCFSSGNSMSFRERMIIYSRFHSDDNPHIAVVEYHGIRTTPVFWADLGRSQLRYHFLLPETAFSYVEILFFSFCYFFFFFFFS